MPDAEYYRDRIERSETVPEARTALTEARGCLAGLLRRAMARVPGETALELAERIVDDGEGWEPRAVADAMRCTPTFVRRARLVLGRDPETGRLTAGRRSDGCRRRASGGRSLIPDDRSPDRHPALDPRRSSLREHPPRRRSSVSLRYALERVQPLG
jgi:hypothetical protein